VTPWDEQSRATPSGQWPGPAGVGVQGVAGGGGGGGVRVWPGMRGVRFTGSREARERAGLRRV